VKDAPEITPVRSAHRFDESALEAYLHSQRAEFSGPLKVQQFEGGQSNPTYHLTIGGKNYVLRKKPPGEILPSAHQVQREHRVMAALAETEVIVPKMYLFCDDPSIIGTDFFVMEMVEGRVTPDVTLPNFTAKERVALYDHFIEMLARLHRVDYQSVGLGEGFGRPGNYFERQISRWSKQYVFSKTEELETMERLMKWLPDNIPSGDETVVVHGDYRIGNTIIHPTEPRIVAILDWELSTLGHPLGDLAYCCMHYYNELENEKALTPLGIPTEKEFLARYCELMESEKIENWTFYIVYNLFRSAAIAQGVYKRGLDGNASSELAMTFGEKCKKYAEKACKMI
jgi:aminoglycoside phosphotransferase (APT) family kinase protein